MSMTFTAVEETHEEDWDGTTRCIVTTIERSPELNVANGNGMAILEMLGEVPDYCGSIATDVVFRALAVGSETAQAADVCEGVALSADGVAPRFVTFGRTAEQVQRYNNVLLEIAEFAHANGGRIGWC